MLRADFLQGIWPWFSRLRPGQGFPPGCGWAGLGWAGPPPAPPHPGDNTALLRPSVILPPGLDRSHKGQKNVKGPPPLGSVWARCLSTNTVGMNGPPTSLCVLCHGTIDSLFPAPSDAPATLQPLSRRSRCLLCASPVKFQCLRCCVRILRTHRRPHLSPLLAESLSPMLRFPKMSQIFENVSVTSVKMRGPTRDAPNSELKSSLIRNCRLSTPNSLITQERRGEARQQLLIITLLGIICIDPLKGSRALLRAAS